MESGEIYAAFKETPHEFWRFFVILNQWMIKGLAGLAHLFTICLKNSFIRKKGSPIYKFFLKYMKRVN